MKILNGLEISIDQIQVLFASQIQMRVTETPVAQEHRLANLNVEAVSFVNVNLHTLDQSVKLGQGKSKNYLQIHNRSQFYFIKYLVTFGMAIFLFVASEKRNAFRS